MERRRGDRGDIVLGWLTKLTVVLGLLGLVGFDLIAVVQARFQADDRASTAARAAADSFASVRDVQKAFDAAYATLVDGDRIETTTFVVRTDGSVQLRLHHQATTLLVKRIGPLRDQADAVATGTAQPPR